MTSQRLTLPVHPTKLHPLTGEPITALGFRANGEPIWPIMGGSGEDGDANDSNDGDDNDSDVDDNDKLDDADSNDDGADDNDDGDDDNPRLKRASRQAAKYRREARDAEQKATQMQQQLQKVVKLLGGDDSDDEPDADKLAQQIADLSGTNSQLTAELTVTRLAAKNGADADALLDSNSFMAQLSELDPEDEDYRTQVASAIKAAVKKDARRYSADQGSAQGGSELDGERREQRSKRPTSLHGAIGAAMGGKG